MSSAPQRNTILRVQGQNSNGVAATSGSTDDHGAREAEMTRPALTPRMEKTHHFCGLGIDAREVRAFVLVVVVARQGEIIRIVGTTVLFGNHVFHVHTIERLIVLMDQAILATVVCPAPNQFTRCGVHQVRSEGFKSLRAFAWMMAM
jgi:hypothetical protein